jgi:transcriptional regulator with XRE-family HTH domain
MVVIIYLTFQTGSKEVVKMISVDLDKIKRLRKEKSITQYEMAKLLGYKTDVGYHYLETGRCQIDAVQLAMIAQILEVPVSQLFAGR